MITEKQMKSLKPGNYSNTDLQRMFPAHCVGKGLRPDIKFDIKTGRTFLANRRQRRAKA
jgi:hypothetical protein